MIIMKTIYVDGGAGKEPHYGYFVKETGQTKYIKDHNITNNEAECKAILRALVDHADSEDPIRIMSDSRNTVNQINHEYAINKDTLRNIIRQIWQMVGEIDCEISFTWVPRKENLAGKMLGS